MEKTGDIETKKERNLQALELKEQPLLDSMTKPTLVIQLPKTPFSRKLKAVSLDEESPQCAMTDVYRDVISMPNTPKKQIKPKLSDNFEDGSQKSSPIFSSNLKKFASNKRISGSQALKTLPEIRTLQDFSGGPAAEPFKLKSRGLLERRGSNASLTIDLGSNMNISEVKLTIFSRLNTAKSVSNLNLSTFEPLEKYCHCDKSKKCDGSKKLVDRRKSQETCGNCVKSQETCGNCVIFESVSSKLNNGNNKYQPFIQCSCAKSRRKSLSNENLYVPPCALYLSGTKNGIGNTKQLTGCKKACYPRQSDVDTSQLFSDDFRLHIKNIQYLQTSGNLLSISDLQQACEISRVPKLHQEFWEVPLNLQEKCYVPGTQSRNRYRGVLPNEQSRVHLTSNQNYIHANYIKGPDLTEPNYIATQGPMTHTCEDFWEMVWSTHCKCIVMLTGLIEKGRSKCELYFPLGKNDDKDEESFYYVTTTKERDKLTVDMTNFSQYETDTHVFERFKELIFGQYRIKFIEEKSIDECHIRKLEVKNMASNESRLIQHYWFSSWPDHKLANPEQILKIALEVLDMIDFHKKHDNNSVGISESNEEAILNRKCHILLKNNNSFNAGTIFSQKGLSTSVIFEKTSLQERCKSNETLKLPLIVHCSAGIGRTGCFLAILNGIQQLRKNKAVDVLAILCSLRLNRGGMVQTAEQYELIHQVLSLFTKGVT